MIETFNHTEQTSDSLSNRLMELSWMEGEKFYTEERRHQLGREAACIIFELASREQVSEQVSGTSAAF